MLKMLFGVKFLTLVNQKENQKLGKSKKKNLVEIFVADG